MHRLLERQLRKYLKSTTPSLELTALLSAVDQAYRDNDDGRLLLERSIELSATELLQRNRQLARELTERKQLELERQQLEVELRQAQKLEAVGQLASGIAHEINTPVQFVGDCVQLLRDSVEQLGLALANHRQSHVTQALDEATRDALRAYDETLDLDYLLAEAPQAGTRAAEGLEQVANIVRAMKEFAHPDGREKKSADLNRALQSTLVVARNELRYLADVETSFAELPSVWCHLGDLNQVFLNILINAAHAVADAKKGDRGKIVVSTRAFPESVLISIEDSGHGIPEAIRTRVFEPFFTTKAVGRGTGQGLAIARSIVTDKHGGQMWFESELGKGTTFFIRLPLGGPEVDSSAAARGEVSQAAP
jgi:two-component system, NtrC family, sensor kinase